MSPRRAVLGSAALAVPLLVGIGPVHQSGRGLMHGYVAFENVSYNEVTEGKIHASVELRSGTSRGGSAYTARTDNRGAYDLPAIGMGEYTLVISAPGYRPYRIAIYIPSDFECRLAVMLKQK